MGADSAFGFICGNKLLAPIGWICFGNSPEFPLLLLALKMLRALVMMSRSMGDKPGVVNRCHKLYCEISPDVNSGKNKKKIRKS